MSILQCRKSTPKIFGHPALCVDDWFDDHIGKYFGKLREIFGVHHDVDVMWVEGHTSNAGRAATRQPPVCGAAFQALDCCQQASPPRDGPLADEPAGTSPLHVCGSVVLQPPDARWRRESV
jgi:hypothetical protein